MTVSDKFLESRTPCTSAIYPMLASSTGQAVSSALLSMFCMVRTHGLRAVSAMYALLDALRLLFKAADIWKADLYMTVCCRLQKLIQQVVQPDRMQDTALLAALNCQQRLQV